MGTNLDFQGQNIVPSSYIELVRPGLRTSTVKSDFVALTKLAIVGGVSTLLSSDSESTQELGSIGHLLDLLDFRVPS